ncbi:DedA family protein [Segetibacter sp. 3557_3]|uniref:DedA family protein n=1 Tax=Segetibacter sp. 3557_3 TaxID=2547429 RepID=UPI001058B182|nr:VTT domain-containing protein [Segetibacter sp. 3557_3]TDH27898.1 DedA family protein [Segetibacter sp. 3557_3]
MDSLLEFIKNLTDPVWINQHGGLYIVVLIIFAETGLFVGFFLPGDSLLFITGMIIANSLAPFQSDSLNLLYWMTLISVAGVIGNMVGYWFGKKSGPLIFERRDTWLFKRKHIVQAKEFYDRRGGSAIIFARFLPIVRTFAPIVAGVVKMDYKKFLFFNVVGCIAWVISMIMAGYLLGANVWVKKNLEYIVIGLVLVTTAPVLFKMFFSKKKSPIIEVAEDIAEEKLKTPSE